MLANAADQVVALFVDGTKAGMFQFQNPVGHMGNDRGITVVGVQDADNFAIAGQVLLFKKQRLDLGPGEKVRVDDLVRVAAENKVTRLAQGFQDQIELDIGDVLNLIHHNKVVPGDSPGQIVMADDIGIKQPLGTEKLAVFIKQVINPGPLVITEDGLFDAQPQVLLPGEPG